MLTKRVTFLHVSCYKIGDWCFLQILRVSANTVSLLPSVISDPVSFSCRLSYFLCHGLSVSCALVFPRCISCVYLKMTSAPVL